MNIFRKLKEWLESKRFMNQQQRGDVGILYAILVIIALLVVLKIFGLI